MELLNDLVGRARGGDLEAYGRLVQVTQTMAYAVALGVLRDSSLAEDAAQEAYLRAFRRLGDLEEPGAFISWLRRIVITVALNMRRARRRTLLRLDDVPDVPVLDEAETSWSELQRQRLAGALLTLTSEERRLCDRRYHGHWSAAPTEYPMYSQAWDLEVEDEGGWHEVLAWGVFTDRIVRHLGGDPEVHSAVGVGCGLERLAMLRYGIDDIRKIEGARVA